MSVRSRFRASDRLFDGISLTFCCPISSPHHRDREQGGERGGVDGRGSGESERFVLHSSGPSSALYADGVCSSVKMPSGKGSSHGGADILDWRKYSVGQMQDC